MAEGARLRTSVGFPQDVALVDAQLQSLPITWVPCTDALLEQAAAIKACHPLSLADAWIAAAAQEEGAVLVHKDPEFRALDQVLQEWLG
jgi:ribonuclease VapC